MQLLINPKTIIHIILIQITISHIKLPYHIQLIKKPHIPPKTTPINLYITKQMASNIKYNIDTVIINKLVYNGLLLELY